MSFSLKFQENIDHLNKIDPSQFSIVINADQSLVPKKVSCIRNFFGWFIHLITFTHIPRNAKLNDVFRYFLEESRKVEDNKITFTEKQSLLNAIQNLEIIIAKHGGSKKKEVKKLIQTINNIISLEVVKELGKDNKKEPVPVIEVEPELCEDEKLKEFWNDPRFKDEEFLIEFFKNCFKDNEIGKQKEYLLDLNPDVIKYWVQFFQALSKIPEAQSKQVLISSTTYLFNHIHFNYENREIFFALTPEQMYLLPIKAYKPEISLLLFCETVSYYSKEMHEFYKNLVFNFTEEQEKVFFTLFEKVYLDKPSALCELIVWLEEIAPKSHLFHTCMTKVWTPGIAGEMDPAKRNKLVLSLPFILVKSYVLPHIANLKNWQFFGILKRWDFLVSIRKWDPKELRDFINKHVDGIIKSMQKVNCKERIYLCSLILKAVDDSNKLKKLLPIVLKYVNENVNVLNNLIPLFEHFEANPWKLLLVLDDLQKPENQILYNWLKEKNYPICKKFLEANLDIPFTKKLCDELNELFQELFALVREDRFDKATDLYFNLDNDIKEYLTGFASHAKPELLKELIYMNDGQIFAAILKEASFKNIQEALHSKESKKISRAMIKRIEKLREAGYY